MTRTPPNPRKSKPGKSRRKLQNSHHVFKAAVLTKKRTRTSVHSAKTLKSANEYRDLKWKAEALGFIVQHSGFHIKRPGNVPPEHQARFEHIQALGRFEYDSYGLQPSPETVDKPWQLLNKCKANKLSQLAIKCKEEKRNEAGWRDSVESKVFERFEIEVACKICRNRIWRSEIEVDPDTSNSRTTSLEERQARRKPCRCALQWRMDNVHDPGLSPIFSSRLEEPNYLPHDHKAEFDPVKNRPDRIHGLQSTTSIEKMLHRHFAAQSQQNSEPSQRLADVLQVTCNPDRGGKNLLFPFLVMEAKKGRSDFDEIEIQTAHPIINLLDLQHQLQHNEFNEMEVPGGPLAWFLANIGERWKVYGCYVTSSGDRSQPSWNIIPLWEGSITRVDEALQLVLIVDYILDWARDTYRPSILRQLKCIGAGEACSDYTVTHDSDVLSMVHPVNGWLGAQSGQASVPTVVATDPRNTQEYLTKNAYVRNALDSQTEILEQERDVKLQGLELEIPNFPDHHGRVKDDLIQFTRPHQVVKDGTTLESRVRGLYITADNLGTLLQGLGNSGSSRATHVLEIEKVVETRSRCFILDDARAIGTLEQIWTGDSATALSHPTLSHPTLISVQVRFWVTEFWKLVRELNYLAITKEAYDDLGKRVTQRPARYHKWKRISAQQLVSFVKDEDKASREDFFLRCLERQVLVLHHSPRMQLQNDARLNGKRGPVSELVAAIYGMHQIGQRKPNEAFIREVETSEEIPPAAGHAFWSAYENGILATGYFGRLCLFVPNKSVATNRLVENLASRFSLDGRIFDPCVTSDSGALLKDPFFRKLWRPSFCNIPRRLQAKELREIGSWILKKKPKMSQLMEMQDAISRYD